MDNRQWRAYHALRKVAKMEGISVQEVVRNIEDVIKEAYSTAQKENDLQVLERWKDIPCENEIPTAVELVTYLGDRLKMKYSQS